MSTTPLHKLCIDIEITIQIVYKKDLYQINFFCYKFNEPIDHKEGDSCHNEFK